MEISRQLVVKIIVILGFSFLCTWFHFLKDCFVNAVFKKYHCCGA